MAPEYSPHDVVWNRELSRRFWDFYSAHPAFEDQYFAARVGGALLAFAARRVDLAGPVLDFGCGPGHLLAALESRGVRAEGVDFSAASVERARRRLGASSAGRVHLAEGLPLPLAAASYATVFLVETVEHLLDADLEPTLAEIHRLLRPGGRVVVTTPHDEDLDRSRVLCPECGCVSHRMQHVRSWTIESLAAEMERHGFRRRLCRAVAWMPGATSSRLVTLAFRLARRKLPDLVYVGERRAGDSHRPPASRSG